MEWTIFETGKKKIIWIICVRSAITYNKNCHILIVLKQPQSENPQWFGLAFENCRLVMHPMKIVRSCIGLGSQTFAPALKYQYNSSQAATLPHWADASAVKMTIMFAYSEILCMKKGILKPCNKIRLYFSWGKFLLKKSLWYSLLNSWVVHDFFVCLQILLIYI